MRKASKAKDLNMNEVEVERRSHHECCRYKEHNVQLCETEDIKIDREFVVNYTDLGK